MQADVYEKIDKELLVYVEDVLLNRRPDSTERLLEYAATLDPKSAPTKLRKVVPDAPGPKIQPKLNPIPPGFNPIAPPEVMPPVPVYKQWVDPLVKSPAFEQLERLFQERIAYIDGGMGTMIQRFKLEVRAVPPPFILQLAYPHFTCVDVLRTCICSLLAVVCKWRTWPFSA